jgi:DNA-binding SARP family transcriptional activator
MVDMTTVSRPNSWLSKPGLGLETKGRDGLKRLQVNLFGGLSVEWQGQTLIKFTTARVRDLLAFLVVAPDYAHHRDDVLRAVWGEDEAEVDRNRLAVALYLLKKDFMRIGFDLAEILEATRDTLLLRGERVTTDWQMFLVASEQAGRTQGPKRELFAREAVQHYRGPLLPESDAVWVWPLRSEVEVAYRQNLLWLAQQELDRDRPDLAQAWINRLQRTDPGSLATLAAVTEWFWMRGHVGEAQGCATRLMQGIRTSGTKVAPETRDLVSRVLGPTVHERWGARVQTLCVMRLDDAGREHLAREWGAAMSDPLWVSDPVAALEMAHDMVPQFVDRAILTTRAMVPGDEVGGAEVYGQVPTAGVYANRATLEVLKASGYAVVAEQTGDLYRVSRADSNG